MYGEQGYMVVSVYVVMQVLVAATVEVVAMLKMAMMPAKYEV